MKLLAVRGLLVVLAGWLAGKAYAGLMGIGLERFHSSQVGPPLIWRNWRGYVVEWSTIYERAYNYANDVLFNREAMAGVFLGLAVICLWLAWRGLDQIRGRSQ